MGTFSLIGCRIDEQTQAGTKKELRVIAVELGKIPEIFVDMLQDETLTSSFVEINILQQRSRLLTILQQRISQSLHQTFNSPSILNSYILD